MTSILVAEIAELRSRVRDLEAVTLTQDEVDHVMWRHAAKLCPTCKEAGKKLRAAYVLDMPVRSTVIRTLSQL